MSGSKRKRQDQPSYELDELRDEKVAQKQLSDFQPKDLLRLIRKAVGKPSEKTNP